jgi:alkanesulfonate monooxygenase SsuD/methylene tetrahydromethanopterin reductase-like flavin-dependent oxidoreductase (luciferase family)
MIYDVEFNSAGQVPSEGILEAARIADETEFGTIWKGESNSRDPSVILSAIAASTKRIGLGTAVIHVFARTPVETGIMCATLDELSKGRFMLGLGVANNTLASWHGLSFSEPLKRAREYIGIVRQVFAAQKMSTTGKYYSSNGFKLEFKPRSKTLPIILAALGPKMAELAGEICEGAIINMADTDRIGFVRQHASEGARKTGRDFADFQIVAKVRCSINKDIEKAKSALRKVVTFYTLSEFYRDMVSDMGFESEVQNVRETHLKSGFKKASECITDDMLKKLPVVPATSFEELRKGLKRFDDCGANRLLLPYVPSTENSTEETIEFVRHWQNR